MELVIAIDGSAGSGKSTLAKTVAMRLNWPWLSTGVMYRAATLATIRASVDPDDSKAVLGGILAIFGLLADKAIYQRSLGININLIWGGVMLLFGVAMLWLGRRAATAPRSADESAADGDPPRRRMH